MASLIIRNLDEDLAARLRSEAAQHGHSMEEEVISILRRATIRQPRKGLGSRIPERFASVGGVALDLPKRKKMPRQRNV